ncbi:uncharacterized protein STEHIDRAFT_124796 [Stereum hirsutum FP-91666 SS1]|uniref:uncharacterized protein n=1 Tax=Stereum hirsutum (strain FP-91666) TaxID=721885 RepID=UPI000444A88A|nr:uncharacterized protein STEHIDRAFT_124796 [Stereum hirsutum FP-91666 SS1]EIM81937.1 hypothetical protein STEHIDRAFT_124796 [Stereum hirsutum FP-91666 SS1]
MRVPVEICRAIFEEVVLDRPIGSRDELTPNFTPNSTLAVLARVDSSFRDLAREGLYSRVYLGPITFKCDFSESLALFRGTMEKNSNLAELVLEIHTGTISGSSNEANHLGCILQCTPNLRVFELRGWAQEGVLPIFQSLKERHHLRRLILSPHRLLAGYSYPLCDAEDLFLLLKHFTMLESVVVHRGTCIIRDSGRHALYETPWTSQSFRAPHASQAQFDREFHQAIVSASPIITWSSGPIENACPHLRHASLVDCMTSESELQTLSTLAPNLTEIAAHRVHRRFHADHPRICIIPALRVWSDRLVKLVLPMIYARSQEQRNSAETWSMLFPHGDDDALANIIAQMPVLRILGIARGSMAPRHFRRGPNSLVALGYYLPLERLAATSPSVLPEFVAVLEDGDTLPHLRHLCLTLESPRRDTDLIEPILSARGVEFYGTVLEWETACDELSVSN